MWCSPYRTNPPEPMERGSASALTRRTLESRYKHSVTMRRRLLVPHVGLSRHRRAAGHGDCAHSVDESGAKLLSSLVAAYAIRIADAPSAAEYGRLVASLMSDLHDEPPVSTPGPRRRWYATHSVTMTARRMTRRHPSSTLRVSRKQQPAHEPRFSRYSESRCSNRSHSSCRCTSSCRSVLTSVRATSRMSSGK